MEVEVDSHLLLLLLENVEKFHLMLEILQKKPQFIFFLLY